MSLGSFSWRPQSSADGNDNFWHATQGNMAGHATSPQEWAKAGLGGPAYGVYGSFVDWNNWHKAKNQNSTDAYNKRTQQQIDSRNSLLDQRTQLLDQYNQQDAQARGGALSSLNAAYSDPSRQQSYDQAYNANLSNSLAGLGAQYQQGAQQQALANAKRGRTGSSYAAEQAAGLQYGYQSGAAKAENDAYGYSQQLSDADFQQNQDLRRAILAGDPQSGAAYQAQAAGANNQASALAGMSSLNAQQRQIGQLYGNAQSQQYGGYGNAAANYVYARNGVYGYGG